MKLRRLYLQNTYKKLLPEFLKESSIHGLKLLLLFTPVKHAKKLWILFMICIIISTHFIIINLTIDFIEQPTEIRMSTKLVHIANSPFPGVAVCSANKISRRKLLDFADKVFRNQEAYQPGLLAKDVNEMADYLLILTGFYVYPYDDYHINDERLVKLHNILTFMHNSTEYASRELLRNLAPDCENLVLRGIVFGHPVNTSELFHKRLTTSSVCCMFNYQRKSNSQDPMIRERDNLLISQTEQIKFEANSILNSVQFVLQSDTDDFAYTDMSNDAFQLYIFPQEDYATIQSSTIGEIFVNYDSIVEIPIQPKFYEASNSIKAFSPRVRKCYFPEEGQKLLNQSYYSIDECLLLCRMQSMLKHCGCVNPSMAPGLLNATVCNLLDLPCLTHWKTIWYGRTFFDHVDEEDDDDGGTSDLYVTATSQRCEHCLPTCEGVDFKIYINDLPLRKSFESVYSHGLLKGLSNAQPLAIIKLFFKQRYAQATKEDIVSDWVTLLNRFGGIMSLIYGFSIVSYIELFYYLSGKWFMYLYRTLKIQIRRKISTYSQTALHDENKENDEPPNYQLYWQELKPKHIDMDMFRKEVILHSYRGYD